jgi:hypothetical protein
MFRRLFKKTESTYKVSIPGLSVELDAPSDLTILEHALMKGVAYPIAVEWERAGPARPNS